MAKTFKETGLFSREELIKFGYAAPTKKEAKTFELPPFVPFEHRRYLPLHIQVMFVDTPVGVNGTEELIFPLRTFGPVAKVAVEPLQAPVFDDVPV